MPAETIRQGPRAHKYHSKYNLKAGIECTFPNPPRLTILPGTTANHASADKPSDSHRLDQVPRRTPPPRTSSRMLRRHPPHTCEPGMGGGCKSNADYTQKPYGTCQAQPRPYLTPPKSVAAHMAANPTATVATGNSAYARGLVPHPGAPVSGPTAGATRHVTPKFANTRRRSGVSVVRAPSPRLGVEVKRIPASPTATAKRLPIPNLTEYTSAALQAVRKNGAAVKLQWPVDDLFI